MTAKFTGQGSSEYASRSTEPRSAASSSESRTKYLRGKIQRGRYIFFSLNAAFPLNFFLNLEYFPWKLEEKSISLFREFSLIYCDMQIRETIFAISTRELANENKYWNGRFSPAVFFPHSPQVSAHRRSCIYTERPEITVKAACAAQHLDAGKPPTRFSSIPMLSCNRNPYRSDLNTIHRIPGD